eukprot:1718150-Rhodomonas_salina.1
MSVSTGHLFAVASVDVDSAPARAPPLASKLCASFRSFPAKGARPRKCCSTGRDLASRLAPTDFALRPTRWWCAALTHPRQSAQRPPRAAPHTRHPLRGAEVHGVWRGWRARRRRTARLAARRKGEAPLHRSPLLASL